MTRAKRRECARGSEGGRSVRVHESVCTRAPLMSNGDQRIVR